MSQPELLFSIAQSSPAARARLMYDIIWAAAQPDVKVDEGLEIEVVLVIISLCMGGRGRSMINVGMNTEYIKTVSDYISRAPGTPVKTSLGVGGVRLHQRAVPNARTIERAPVVARVLLSAVLATGASTSISRVVESILIRLGSHISTAQGVAKLAQAARHADHGSIIGSMIIRMTVLSAAFSDLYDKPEAEPIFRRLCRQSVLDAAIAMKRDRVMPCFLPGFSSIEIPLRFVPKEARWHLYAALHLAVPDRVAPRQQATINML